MEGALFLCQNLPLGTSTGMDSLTQHPIWRALAAAIVPYVVWRLHKRLRGMGPLADIPGPPADNWLTGGPTPPSFRNAEGSLTRHISGSFMKIFPMDSGGWEYHDDLVHKCAYLDIGA